MATQLVGLNQCSVCRTEEGLSFCSACKVVQYCSEAHLAAHRPVHKKWCTAAKRALSKRTTAERNLRQEGTRAFEDYTGSFWGVHETRPYMRARADLIDALSNVKTRKAVIEALRLAMENMRLSEDDNIGTRQIIPTLMIRVGLDRDAYNFIKRQEIQPQTIAEMLYGQPEPPTDPNDQDMFEPVDVIPSPRFGMLGFQSALALLKSRLLSDLRTLHNSIGLTQQLALNLEDVMQNELMTDAIPSHPQIMQDLRDRQDVQQHIEMMEQQTNEMFARVHRRNEHFWPTIPVAESIMDKFPDLCSPGNQEEVNMVLIQSHYAAWKETPGAIDWVTQKLAELN